MGDLLEFIKTAGICGNVLQEQALPIQNGLKKAFRAWSLTHHPDKITGDADLFMVVSDCVQKVIQDKEFAFMVSFFSKSYVTPQAMTAYIEICRFIVQVLVQTLKGHVTMYMLYYVVVLTKFIILSVMTYVWSGTTIVVTWFKALGITIPEDILKKMHLLRLNIWETSRRLTKREYNTVEKHVVSDIDGDILAIQKVSPVDEVAIFLEYKTSKKRLGTYTHRKSSRRHKKSRGQSMSKKISKKRNRRRSSLRKVSRLRSAPISVSNVMWNSKYMSSIK